MKVIIACVVALLIVMGGGIALAIHFDSEFEARCHRDGGHTVDVGKGYMLCVDQQGRILYSS